MDDNNIVKCGDFVLIQRQDYMRLHKIKENGTINLSSFVIETDNLIGCRYNETFQMKLKPGSRKLYTLEKVKCINNDAMNIDVASGKDNRNIIDDGSSQALSKEAIEKLRDDANTSNEILEQLVSNSKTFASKTEYSQAKYLKKKQKKYFDYLTVRRPTIRLLARTFYKLDANKILDMRYDDLAQILTYANVQANGNYLLFDSGTCGLLSAAILNRIGARNDGKLIYMHPGNECQKNALMAMKFPNEQYERFINVNLYSVLRWYYQRNNQNRDYDDSTSNKKRKMLEDTTSDGRKRPCWHFNNEHACNLLEDKQIHGLIIASKEHPQSLVDELTQFLQQSRTLVVYHQIREALQDVYQSLMKRSDFINVRLINNFMRQYQVLPERTHPLVNMDFGGFILTATKINA